MAISYATLRSAALSSRVTVAKTLSEADERGIKTAFLCHSHNDKALVKGFVSYVQQNGWKLYIDWQDTSMPANPNRVTAEKIQARIRSTDLFIFLATDNSVSSRWCPWEIGYADGVKEADHILVVKTKDDYGNFHGNEYLGLYRKLDVAKDGKLAAWRPNEASGTYATAL